MDMSLFSDDDLRAFAEGDISKVSTAGLQLLSGTGLPPPKPTGDTSGFGAAFGAGLKDLQGQFALTRGKMGLLDDEEAKSIYAKKKAESEAGFTPTKGGWTDDFWNKFKETAGGSAAYMIGPLAAGAVATGAAAAAPALAGAAGIAGLAGGFGIGVGQFTGSNLGRQMEEGTKYEDLGLGKAALSAIPQAALDTLSMKLLPGIGRLLGSVGKEVTEETAKAMAQQSLKAIAADYLKATGRAMGTEGITEAAQQVFERAQAGLSITDEKARAEYVDNFIGGAVLGGAMSPVGHYSDRGNDIAKGEALGRKRVAEEQKVALEAETQSRLTKLADPEYAEGIAKQMAEANAQLEAMNPGKRKKDATLAEKIEHAQAWKEYNAFETSLRPLQEQYEEVAPLLKKRAAETAAADALKAKEEKEALEAQGLAALTGQRDTLQIQLVEAKKAAKTAAAEGNIEGAAKAQETMDALAEQLKGLAPTITKLQDAAPPTVSDPEALLAKMQKQYAAHIDGGRGAKAAELLPEIGRLHTQVQATRQAFPSAEGAVPGNQTAGPNPFAPPAAAATDTTVPPAAPPAAPNQTNDLLRQVFGTDAAAVAEDAQSRDLYSKPTAAARTPDSTTNNTLALKQEAMFGDIEPGGVDPRVGKASQLLAQIEQLQNRPNMPPETQRALENYAKALANPAFEGITQQDYDTALKNAGKVATHPDMVGVTNIGAQNALMRLAENINKIAYQGYGQGEERALNRAEVNARIAAVDAKLNAWRPDPEAIAQARAALQAAKTETADGVIRANAVDPATGKVVARNQTAFDRQAVLKRELDNLLRPTALLAERERLRSSGLGVNMTPYDRQQKQLTTVGTGTSTDIAGEATPEQIANARMVRPKGELVKETGVPAAETADGVARANEIDPATGEVVARNQPFKRPAPRPSELGREVIAVNANPDTVQEQSSFLGAVDEDGAQSTVERVAPPGSGVMDRGITRVERGVERGVGMTRALPSDTEVTAAMQELSPADKQTLNLWDNVFGEGSAANRLVRDAEAGLAKAQSAVDVANGELAGLKAALEEALTPIKAVIGDVLPVKRAAESSEAHAAAMEKYAADVKATEDAKFDAAQGEVQGIGQKIVAATKRLERAKGELDAEMKRLQATGELSPEFMQFIGDSNLEAEVEKATAAVADVLNRSTSGNANNVRILADGMGGAAAKATSALQVQSLIQNTIPDVRRLMGPRVATLVETLLRVKAANNIMGTVQRLTSYIQYSEEALATTLPRAREAAVKAAQKQAAAGDKTTTAATIKADIARAEATAKQEAYQALLKKIDDFTATDPKAKAASKAVAGKTSEIEQLQKTSLDRVTKARTDVARAKETRKLVMENEQALRSGKPSPLQASIAANVKNTEAIYNSTEAALRGAWDTRADARAELTEDVMSFENLLADLARTEAALADLWAGHASSTVDMESEAATLIDAAALLAPTVYDTQMIDANRALDKAELVGGARAAAAEEATLMSELDNALKPLRERLKENADLQKNPQSASHRSALLEHQNRIIKQMNATADLYRERLQAARAEKAQMGEESQTAPDPDSKGWALEQLTNLKVRREAVQAQLDSIAAGIDSIRAERAELVAAERQKQTDVMKTARELGAATDDVRNADTRAKLSEMLNDQRVLEERADKEIAAAEGIVNAAIARVKEEGYTDLDAMQEYRTARKVYDEAVAARARVYDHSLQMMRDQIELVKSLPAMERTAPTPQNAFFNSPAPVAEANPAAVATTAQALKEGVVSGPEQTETAAERAAFEERVNTTDDPAALRKELGGYEGDVANIEAEIEGLAAKTDMQHPMIKLLRKNLAEAEALLEKMYKPSFFDRSLPKADLEKAITNVQARVQLERTRLENGIKGLREKSSTLKQRNHMSPEAAAQLRADIQRRMADGQRKLDAAEKARDAVNGLIPTRITKAIANAQEEIAAAKEDWKRLDMVRGKDTNIRMGLLEKKAALEEKITTITERLSRVERGQSVATIAATQGPAVRRGVATKTALNAGDMISGDVTAVAGKRQADGSVGEATTVTKESKVGTRNKVTEKLIHPKVTAEQAVAQANDDMRESNALRSEMVWAKLARDLEAAIKERAEAKLSNDAVQKSKAGAPAKAAAAQRLKDAIAAVKAADAALKKDTSLPAASTAVQRLEKDSREDIAGPPVVYRTSTTTGTGMKAAEVTRLANRITEGWTNTPNTVVVDTEAQLPQRLQDQAARDGMTGKVPGLFDPDSKTVYLVAANLHNGRDVALTIVHEVAGHYGLRDMMGDAYTDTMNRLYEGNASVAQAADKLMAADPRLSKEIAVEETLADMSETTPGKEGVSAALSRVFYAVKQWLWKKLGLKGVTDGEVRQIVANARRHVKRGEARGDSAGGEAVYRTAAPDYGRLAGTPITKVGNVVPPDSRTTMQRVLDSISEAWNTGVVDMHAPVKNAMELAKGAGVDGKLVEQALHSLVRTGYSSSLVSQFMTNGGPETVRDSKGLISQRAGGAPSAMEVLAAAEGIPGGNSAAKFELATSYRLAKRGLRVGANKISFNTTPAQLTAVLQQVNADPELKAALNNFNNLYDKYNEALVTWAMESGAITPDLASEMLRHKDYVPMYRNNGGILQIAFGDSQWHRLGDIANTPFMHKLKGGDEAIMPINESIMYNTKLLTDMALVNMAKRNIAYVLQAAGKGKAANGKNKMSVIAGIPPAGRQYLKWKQTPLGSSDRGDRFLEIDTENTALAGIPTDMLAQSIEGHHATMPAYLKWSSYLNDLLRAGVTRVPAYTLRQLIKDPSSIASTSGLEANPLTAVARAFKEYGKGMANRNADIDDMNRRALVQSNILTGDFDDFIKLTHMLADGANPSKTRQFLNLLDKSAHMADAATRVQVYNDSIKRGLSEVEAERRVMESMNFHKRGAWATIQHANRLLPFFNAGIQAINVSIKALQGKMPFEEELKVRQTYLNNMMMLAIGGVAYATMMGDNDEYAKLKPSDKFGFLHIPLPGTDTLLKLPYTYAEGGGMAIAMGQALVEGFKDNAEANQLLKALFMYGVRALPNQGNLPIPQGLKQAIGVSLNSNMDTWKPIPIVSRSLSSLTPEKQFDANTPEAFKLLGEATGTSPKKLAWFADQVTGNIASAVMGTLDAVNPMMGGVAQAEKRLDQVPFIKSLFQNPTTSAASEMAFARASEATVAHQTLGNMRNRGASAEEIKDFIDSHIKDLRAQPLAGKFVQKLGAINTAMERLRNADMPATEKTQRIRELEKVRNEIAETVEQAFKELDAIDV